MATFAIIIALAWFIRMVENILFHVALWQKKEYRWDRMRSHLTTRAGLRLLLNPFSLMKWLLVTLFFLHDYAHVQYFIPPGLLLFIAGLIWTAEAAGAIIKLGQHRTIFPKITLRSGLLLALLVFFTLEPSSANFINLGGIRWNNFYYEWFWRNTYFLGLFADRSLPIYTFLLTIFTQPFVEWRKRHLVRKATRKIQTMRPRWVIGITGSYGKTSTKEILAHILSQKFKVLKTPEHINADIGIARQILQELRPEHEVYIVEMGAYHMGAIKRDCQMVRPNIGILTGIGPQHLSLFGSMERLIMAKSELFGALPKEGLAITHGDSQPCREIAKLCRAPVKFFGLRDPADVVAKKIEVTSQQLSFDIHIEKEHARVVAPLLGDLFVPNLLAAIAVAHYLGMTLSEIVAAIESLPGLPRTMEQRTGPGGIIIIDDSYSANPDGVVAALNALKVFPGRKYLVMPSMIELGTEYRAAHERVGEQAGTICNAIFLTDQDAIDHIKRGVERSSTIDKIKTSKNSTDLASLIFQSLVPGDVLLIEGRIPESLRQRFIL